MQRLRSSVVFFCLAFVGGCDEQRANELAAYDGEYRGEDLTLTLKAGEGKVTGLVTFKGKRYPIVAHPEGDGLAGTFDTGKKSYPLKLTKRSNGRLRLTTGGKSYTVARVDSENPLADKAAAGGKKAPAGKPSAGGADEPGEAVGASDPPAAKPRWEGSYRGSVNGTPATLRLTTRGKKLSGRVDAGGYPYEVHATIVGEGLAKGRVTDGKTGSALPAKISLSGRAVRMTLSAPAGKMRLRFRRGGGAETAAVGRSGGARASGGGQHDRRLVGRWGRNHTMISGGASMVTSYYLIVRPNGTYTTGTGRMSAGGSGWTAGSGGGGGTSGRWKTKGNIVYVQQGGVWRPYARFFRRGGSLMLTFANGKRQVWHRR